MNPKISLLFICLLPALWGKGPPNDNFAGAIELGGEKFPYNHRGSLTDKLDRFRATVEEGEPNHAGQEVDGSVWFHWTAKESRKMRIYSGSPNENMRLILAVYSGHSLNDLTLVHRYSEFAYPAFSRTANEPFNRSAYLQFDAKKGQKYYFVIATENEVFDNFYILLHTYWNNFQPIFELLPANSKWQYLLAKNDEGIPVDPKSLDEDFYHTWMFPKRYDGPKFEEGAAPVGYGHLQFGNIRSNLGGRRNFLPTAGNRKTVYLRTSFTPPLDVTTLGIEGAIDDGAIIYLNGREVLRYNVDDNKDPQDWQTTAKDKMANQWSATENYILTETLTGLNLPADVPVTLTLSLHNHTADDDDLGMNLRVYALSPNIKSR